MNHVNVSSSLGICLRLSNNNCIWKVHDITETVSAKFTLLWLYDSGIVVIKRTGLGTCTKCPKKWNNVGKPETLNGFYFKHE